MDKNEITDNILAHLYGEMNPEEEDHFLAEAENDKELGDELAETRKLLTAYRIAPEKKAPAIDLNEIMKEAAREKALRTPLYQEEEPVREETGPVITEKHKEKKTAKQEAVIPVIDMTSSKESQKKPAQADEPEMKTVLEVRNSDTPKPAQEMPVTQENIPEKTVELSQKEPSVQIAAAEQPAEKIITIPEIEKNAAGGAFPLFKVAAVIAVVAGGALFFAMTPESAPKSEKTDTTVRQTEEPVLSQNVQEKAAVKTAATPERADKISVMKEQETGKDTILEKQTAVFAETPNAPLATPAPAKAAETPKAAPTADLAKIATPEMPKDKETVTAPVVNDIPDTPMIATEAIETPKVKAIADEIVFEKDLTQAKPATGQPKTVASSNTEKENATVASGVPAIDPVAIEKLAAKNSDFNQLTTSGIPEFTDSLQPHEKQKVSARNSETITETSDTTDKDKTAALLAAAPASPANVEGALSNIDDNTQKIRHILKRSSKSDQAEAKRENNRSTLSSAPIMAAEIQSPAVGTSLPEPQKEVAKTTLNADTAPGIPGIISEEIKPASMPSTPAITSSTGLPPVNDEVEAPQKMTAALPPMPKHSTETKMRALTPTLAKEETQQSSAPEAEPAQAPAGLAKEFKPAPLASTGKAVTDEAADKDNNNKLSDAEKIKMFNITGLESPEELLSKARLLNEYQAYMRALFAVSEALDKGLTGSNLREALTMKARMEFKLRQYDNMGKTIDRLRESDPTAASALEMLRMAAQSRLNNRIIISQPSVKSAVPAARSKQAPLPGTKAYSTEDKNKFNPTTDPYYRDN